MKAFRDSIAFGETPHADNGFKPLPYRASLLLERFRCVMEQLPHHFLQLCQQRHTGGSLLLPLFQPENRQAF